MVWLFLQCCSMLMPLRESRWVSSFISLSAARSSAASGTATVRLAPAISSSFCPAARSAAYSWIFIFLVRTASRMAAREA